LVNGVQEFISHLSFACGVALILHPPGTCRVWMRLELDGRYLWRY
jgi:hypothetical protein